MEFLILLESEVAGKYTVSCIMPCKYTSCSEIAACFILHFSFSRQTCVLCCQKSYYIYPIAI